MLTRTVASPRGSNSGRLPSASTPIAYSEMLCPRRSQRYKRRLRSPGDFLNRALPANASMSTSGSGALATMPRVPVRIVPDPLGATTPPLECQPQTQPEHPLVDAFPAYTGGGGDYRVSAQ